MQHRKLFIDWNIFSVMLRIYWHMWDTVRTVNYCCYCTVIHVLIGLIFENETGVIHILNTSLHKEWHFQLLYDPL